MDEWLSWLGRAVLGGVIGWGARRTLEGATSEVEKLRRKPLKTDKQYEVELTGEYSDEDLEELLTHFLDSAKGADEITIIKSRVEVTVTYWHIKIRRLITRDNSKGV